MKRKHKHIIKTTPWSRFRDYFSNVLSPAEMHQLERNVISDPFEKDAYDGFELFAPASVENDLNILSERLKRKTGYTSLPKTRAKIPVRYVAAVIAVILVTPLIFWLVSKPGKQLSDQTQPMQKEVITVAKTDSGLATDTLPASSKTDATIAQLIVDDKETVSETNATYIYEKKEKPSVAPVSVRKVLDEPLKPLEVKRSTQQIVSEPVTVEPIENVLFTEESEEVAETLQGTVASVVSIEAAPKAGAQNENTINDDRTRQGSVATKPQPSVAEYSAKIKAAVVKALPDIKCISTIEFTINLKGEPENFVVKQSIDQKADRQIIREIKRADKWIPAYYLSEPVESVTTLTIVF